MIFYGGEYCEGIGAFLKKGKREGSLPRALFQILNPKRYKEIV